MPRNTPPQSGDTNIGDGHIASRRDWSFGNGLASVFDTHIARSIPFYNQGHALIVGLSEFLLARGSMCIEMGCSTGTLTARLADHHRNRSIRFVAFDSEPTMVEKAKEKLASFQNVQVLGADATEYNFDGCDLVISYYTLQFVPLRIRSKLVGNICQALPPGGALICFEKVRGDCGLTHGIFQALQTDFKQQQGYSIEQITNKDVSLRSVMEPLTSKENREMLLHAGFNHVEPVFRYLGWEGVIAVKRAF